MTRLEYVSIVMYDTWEDQMALDKLELTYNLNEANAEIARHHIDFARISLHAARAEVLLRDINFDSLFTNQENVEELLACIRTIRNVVG